MDPHETPRLLPWGPHILDRMVRAVEADRERLLRATAALDAAKIPYAVAGGHAVATWVELVGDGGVRHSPDIDLVVRRSDLDAVSDALSNAGFHRRNAEGAVTFLDGPPGRLREAINIHLSGEFSRVTDDEPGPDAAESKRPGSYCVLSLAAVVRMMLSAYRTREKVLLRDLIDVGLIDAGWIPLLSKNLASRLAELLDNPEG